MVRTQTHDEGAPRPAELVEAMALVISGAQLPAEADPYRALAGEFLASLDVSTSTRADYAGELDRFRAWLGQDGGQVRPDTLRRYRDGLLARGLSPLSVGTYLTAPRRFFAFLQVRGATLFALQAKRPRVAKGHRRDTLGAEDLRAVLAAIDTGTLVGLRDYALIVVLAQTGLRTVELERATVGDLRPSGDTTALVVQGKGHAGKDAPVYLEPAALAPLRHYLQERARLLGLSSLPEAAPLFAAHGHRNPGRALSRRSIRHTMARRFQAAGIKTPRLTAHSLRHTAATQALRGGAELVQVRDMLRHADVRTTMTYLHNLEREEKRAERFVDYGLPTFRPRPVGAR